MTCAHTGVFDSPSVRGGWGQLNISIHPDGGSFCCYPEKNPSLHQNRTFPTICPKQKRVEKGSGRETGFLSQRALGGPGWVAQWVRASSPCAKACGFGPWSGHQQESTNKCVNKWNNKSMFYSQINKLKKIKEWIGLYSKLNSKNILFVPLAKSPKEQKQGKYL